MTLVIDASVVLAALLGDEDENAWATGVVESGDLLASTHVMPVEVTNALRRRLLFQGLEPALAARAFARLDGIPAALYAFSDLAPRIWELRYSVTPYDAWYVALAEALDADLATLDRRLTRAPGPRCAFRTP